MLTSAAWDEAAASQVKLSKDARKRKQLTTQITPFGQEVSTHHS